MSTGAASRRRIVAMVAGREIRTRLASKAFRIGTAVLVLIAVGMVVLAGVVDGPGQEALPEYSIALVGPAADDAELFAGVAEGSARLTVFIEGAPNPNVNAFDLDGAFDGTTLSTTGTPDPLLVAIVDRAAQAIRLADVAAANGLDAETVLAAASGTIEVDDLDEEDDDTAGIRLAVGLVATLALFLVIQVFGAQTAASVVEEKSTRVIEVLLAHVRPHELLAGKVAGVAVLAAIEMTIVAAGLAGALAMTTSVAVPPEVWGSVAVLGVVFVIGFLFYAVLFAAAGSLVSRQEDVQQVLLPLFAPLMFGYFVGMAPVLSAGPLGVAMAYIPLTSPAVLPSRYASGEMALWQVAVALALLVVATVAALRVAARVYDASILRIGTRVRVRDALRSRH